MTEDEVKEAVEHAGTVILNILPMKIQSIKKSGYEPKTLIIWKEYYELMKQSDNLKSSHCYPNPGINKIFGLDIVITDIPDVLEVY